jgi:hypothetical protein
MYRRVPALTRTRLPRQVTRRFGKVATQAATTRSSRIGITKSARTRPGRPRIRIHWLASRTAVTPTAQASVHHRGVRAEPRWPP